MPSSGVGLLVAMFNGDYYESLCVGDIEVLDARRGVWHDQCHVFSDYHK